MKNSVADFERRTGDVDLLSDDPLRVKRIDQSLQTGLCRHSERQSLLTRHEFLRCCTADATFTRMSKASILWAAHEIFDSTLAQLSTSRFFLRTRINNRRRAALARPSRSCPRCEAAMIDIHDTFTLR